MDLKINGVDHRSPYPGLPSTSLSLLVSVSTVSIGGLLLLGENPAYGHSVTTAVESCLPGTIKSCLPNHANPRIDPNTKYQTVATTQESELSGWVTANLPLDGVEGDDFGLMQVTSELTVPEPTYETIPEEQSEANLRAAEHEAIDWARLENEPLQLNASRIDLLQAFDIAVSQFSEPYIPIPDSPKEVQANSLAPESIPDLSQVTADVAETTSPDPSQQAEDLGEPVVTAQGVYLLEGDESSARARLSASYALTPNVLFGATLDWTTGDAFTDSPEEGFDLNELYVTLSSPSLPSLRLTLGMIDLTSYFDRNSFAKDAATHFFNPVFQTNPALTAAGIGSRPGVLVNWDLTDFLSMRGAAFSSDRDLDEFAFDAAAAEVALRLGHFIVRGTYVTDRDAGQESGFNEIFSFPRGNDDFGLEADDREVAYGVNAEYFIPAVNLGFFARYGYYENQTLDQGGYTYSLGLNALDLFFADDRLGLAYGRELSNDSLRRDQGEDISDVLELFYDVRLTRNFRVGASLQAQDGFSETVAGLRVRADFNLSELWR